MKLLYISLLVHLISSTTYGSVGIVKKALEAQFTTRNQSALGEYYRSEVKSHIFAFPDGIAPLMAAIDLSRPELENMTYDQGFIFADENFVVSYGRLHNVSALPLVGVAVARLHRGKIAEYWNVMQADIAPDTFIQELSLGDQLRKRGSSRKNIGNSKKRGKSASGRAFNRAESGRPLIFPKFSPPKATHGEISNKQRFKNMFRRVFVAKNFSSIPIFFKDSFVDHDPILGPVSVTNISDVWAISMPPNSTFELGFVFGQSNYVFATRRLNVPGASSQIFADLFRYDAGLIAEHWILRQEEIPLEQMASNRPMFPAFPAGEGFGESESTKSSSSDSSADLAQQPIESSVNTPEPSQVQDESSVQGSISDSSNESTIPISNSLNEPNGSNIISDSQFMLGAQASSAFQIHASLIFGFLLIILAFL